MWINVGGGIKMINLSLECDREIDFFLIFRKNLNKFIEASSLVRYGRDSSHLFQATLLLSEWIKEQRRRVIYSFNIKFIKHRVEFTHLCCDIKFMMQIKYVSFPLLYCWSSQVEINSKRVSERGWDVLSAKLHTHLFFSSILATSV